MDILKRVDHRLVRVIKNVGWLFFDRMFRMGTAMLVGIWLARYLGPEQYGLLNYAYVFPLMLAAFANLGINNILTSEIPVETDASSVNRLVLTSIGLKLIAGVLAFGAVMVANYTFNRTNDLLLLLISISAVNLVVQGFDSVDIYFQSIRKIQYSILPKIIAFCGATAVRIYGLTTKQGLVFFVVVTAVELIVGYLSIYSLFLWQRRLLSSKLLIIPEIAKRLLKLSWPLMLSEFFIFIYMRIDQIMIENLSNSAELGRYSAALRLSEVWYFVASALTAAVYPGIVMLRTTDYRVYISRYQQLLNGLASLGITIGLAFSIIAEPLVALLYGSQYTGVGQILSIHIWTGLFVFLAVGSNNWFVVENLQTFLMGRTIVGAVVNIILNLLLIPAYGAVGASIATLSAQICAAYLTNGIYNKTREVFILQTNALFFLPRSALIFVRRAFSV